MPPRVLKLFRAPKRGWPMEELPEVAALQERGFEGCAHGRPGSKRQVLLVDRETLDALELGPGMIRENITTEGLNVNGLPLGASLQVGQALLEVTIVCTPWPNRRSAPRAAKSNPRPAWNALPHRQRRNHPPGRCHRKTRLISHSEINSV